MPKSNVKLYTYWPGKFSIGTVTDISPLGVQLISSIELTKHQLIKVDGEDFKALGIVSYANANEHEGSKENYTIGIQFFVRRQNLLDR